MESANQIAKFFECLINNETCKNLRNIFAQNSTENNLQIVFEVLFFFIYFVAQRNNLCYRLLIFTAHQFLILNFFVRALKCKQQHIWIHFNLDKREKKYLRQIVEQNIFHRWFFLLFKNVWKEFKVDVMLHWSQIQI